MAVICPVGIPQHVIQRGNNRQACFNSDEDFGNVTLTPVAL